MQRDQQTVYFEYQFNGIHYPRYSILLYNQLTDLSRLYLYGDIPAYKGNKCQKGFAALILTSTIAATAANMRACFIIYNFYYNLMPPILINLIN